MVTQSYRNFAEKCNLIGCCESEGWELKMMDETHSEEMVSDQKEVSVQIKQHFYDRKNEL